MKGIVLLVVFAFVVCLPLTAQETTLIKKAFDVKKLFGVDFGDSKDSLVRLAENVLPIKKEQFVILSECQSDLFGASLYGCTAIVSNGKIERFIAYAWDEDVPALVDSLRSNTVTVSLPRARVGLTAKFSNCTITYEVVGGKFKYKLTFIKGGQ